MNHYVYIHAYASGPSAGKFFYVGKGQGRRASVHFGRSESWTKIYKKYGRVIIIARKFNGNDDALEFERVLIAFLRKNYDLVNLTTGGQGYKISKEARLKMRLVKLGKKQSPEHAQKSRTNKVGFKVSDTSKFNLDKRKPIKNSDGEVFESAAQAARVISKRLGVNASQGNITMCVHGKRNIAYGFLWSFVDEPV